MLLQGVVVVDNIVDTTDRQKDPFANDRKREKINELALNNIQALLMEKKIRYLWVRVDVYLLPFMVP
jgi:hypothetical protein